MVFKKGPIDYEIAIDYTPSECPWCNGLLGVEWDLLSIRNSGDYIEHSCPHCKKIFVVVLDVTVSWNLEKKVS